MSASTASGPPPSGATIPAPPQGLGGKLRTFLEAIKFEHTIFALPFAYLGMLLAAGGPRPWPRSSGSPWPWARRAPWPWASTA